MSRETIKSNILKIKDPGSAITHFIAMALAILAAGPLLIKAARVPDVSRNCPGCLYCQHDFIICCQHHLSYPGYFPKNQPDAA